MDDDCIKLISKEHNKAPPAIPYNCKLDCTEKVTSAENDADDDEPNGFVEVDIEEQLQVLNKEISKHNRSLTKPNIGIVLHLSKL